MAVEDDKLAQLVQGGAMIADYGPGCNGAPYLPIHAELCGPGARGARMLYYVEAGATDQHNTHARAFDKVVVVHERDLYFTLDGKMMLYVAPLAEWPEVSTDDMNQRLALARHAVAAGAARATFEQFVADNRPDAALLALPLPEIVANN